jgi:hypothetical protein
MLCKGPYVVVVTLFKGPYVVVITSCKGPVVVVITSYKGHMMVGSYVVTIYSFILILVLWLMIKEKVRKWAFKEL